MIEGTDQETISQKLNPKALKSIPETLKPEAIHTLNPESSGSLSMGKPFKLSGLGLKL